MTRAINLPPVIGTNGGNSTKSSIGRVTGPRGSVRLAAHQYILERHGCSPSRKRAGAEWRGLTLACFEVEYTGSAFSVPRLGKMTRVDSIKASASALGSAHLAASTCSEEFTANRYR